MSEIKKYGVMVVEDEILQRESISLKINAFSDRFSVIKEASNGADALEYLKLNRNDVDIIFTDIVMPVMNGIDFIIAAKDLFPDLIIIILSGYSEFSYAQKALQYGVYDYLLKPVMRDSIYSVLTRISCTTNLFEADPQREINLKALFSNRLQSALTNSFSNDTFNVALMCLGNYVSSYRYSQDFEDAFDCIWSYIDLKRVVEAVSYSMKISVPYVLSSENPNECYIVFLNDRLEKPTMEAFLRAVRETVSNGNNIPPVSMVYCESSLGASEIYSCGKFMRRIYYERYIPWRSDIMVFNKSKQENMLLNRSVLSVSIEPVINAAVNGRVSELKQELFYTLTKWRDTGVSLYQYYQNLIYLIKGVYHKSLRDDARAWDVLQKNVVISFATSCTLDDFFESFIDLLFEYCQFEESFKSIDGLLHQIKKYIDKNYRSYINMYEIAEKYNISYSYLCKRFKVEFGRSPINYLITIRINEAIKLMREKPDMELKRISEFSGYSDYFYFSKLFKKYTGFSPTAYRKQLEQY